MNRPRTRDSGRSVHVNQEGSINLTLSLHISFLSFFHEKETGADGAKAVAVRKHLERNRKDKDSKFRLILIESRIHRLSRYYKSVGVLPPTWRYESATASTMVA